jgi:hypothetical protein
MLQLIRSKSKDRTNELRVSKESPPELLTTILLSDITRFSCDFTQASSRVCGVSQWKCEVGSEWLIIMSFTMLLPTENKKLGRESLVYYAKREVPWNWG